ncbi:ABC transporter substrate-binding protein [Christensenella intestinihominis]|uniref:ABC transporter substrate-binding protein n=1 Tax=Christensenella intestinihominis TaxID=1851429 RepID=UPI00082B5362|nr:extracellular solute-binding protein [Christensenella intestinihominis]
MNKLTRILCGILAAAALLLFVAQLSCRSALHNENKLVIAVAYDGDNNHIEVQNLEYISRCVDAFHAQNPDIDIRVETISYDTYSNWLYDALLYGEAPDLFTVLPQDFPSLISLDVLEDIGGEAYESRIVPAILETWERNGALYAVPYATSPPCLIMNKTLLSPYETPIDDINFDWFDLYYYCRNYTFDSDGNGIVDTFGVSDMNWRTAVYANGQSLFDPVSRTTDFNNPNVEYSVKLATSMNRLTLEDYDGSFEQNHALIKVTNLAEARYYTRNYPQMDLQILRIPKGPDGPYRTEPYDCCAFGINKNGGAKAAAKQFLQYIALDETLQSEFLSYGYAFPVLENVQQAEDTLKSMEPYMNPRALQLLLSESETIPIEFVEYYDLMNIADKEIFQYIQSNIDIGSELNVLNNRMKEMFQDTLKSGTVS